MDHSSSQLDLFVLTVMSKEELWQMGEANPGSSLVEGMRWERAGMSLRSLNDQPKSFASIFNTLCLL